MRSVTRKKIFAQWKNYYEERKRRYEEGKKFFEEGKIWLSFALNCSRWLSSSSSLQGIVEASFTLLLLCSSVRQSSWKLGFALAQSQFYPIFNHLPSGGVRGVVRLFATRWIWAGCEGDFFYFFSCFFCQNTCKWRIFFVSLQQEKMRQMSATHACESLLPLTTKTTNKIN